MIAGSSYTGGSITSFIDGPMKKIGNTNFTFPVGTGGIYAPIGITNGTGELATDEFTAQYVRANPQNVYGNSYFLGSGIDHISYAEYWTLERDILSTANELGDEGTSTLLTDFITEQEKTIWMYSSWLNK